MCGLYLGFFCLSLVGGFIVRKFKYVAVLFVFLFLTMPVKSDVPAVIFAKYVYELTSKSNNIIYLFGSTHAVYSNKPLNLSQCVKDVFTKSDRVYLEADQLASRLLMVAPVNTVSMSVVSDYLDVDTLNTLAETVFGSRNVHRLLGLDVQLLLGRLAEITPGWSKFMGVPDLGLDAELLMAARFLNKKIEYIEMPEDQLRFLRLVPPQVYASEIKEALRSVKNKDATDNYFKNFFLLMDAAAIGDEEVIVEMLRLDSVDGYHKYTGVDRNESITEKILERAINSNGEKIFIALGATHLAGAGSVVQRLKSSGYTAKRLCL